MGGYAVRKEAFSVFLPSLEGENRGPARTAIEQREEESPPSWLRKKKLSSPPLASPPKREICSLAFFALAILAPPRAPRHIGLGCVCLVVA